MVSKGPSASGYSQQLQQQQQMNAMALSIEMAKYKADFEAQKQALAAQAAASQAKMQSSIRKKAGQPIKLGTLLTSPVGILGNPVLSSTKLS